MNSEIPPVKLSLRERRNKPVFKAVLVYEDVAAAVRARRFCERLVRVLGSTLEEQIWNFDVLGIREVGNLAASAARKADIVIVSLSGRTELPHTIRGWLNMWLWLLEEENPTLVTLFESSARQKTAHIRAYLGSIAQRGQIAFFQNEVS
jgi:hypothetical protein